MPTTSSNTSSSSPMGLFFFFLLFVLLPLPEPVGRPDVPLPLLRTLLFLCWAPLPRPSL